MSDPSLNPEYAQALEEALDLLRKWSAPISTAPPLGNIEARRELFNKVLPALLSRLPPTPDIEKSHAANVPSYDGYEVPLYRFSKNDATSGKPGPAIVYVHGGGYLCLSVELYAPLLSTYVSLSGVPIYAMDYRLSPEHHFPTPLQDCYTSLRYVHDHAAELGVDPSRIAMMGDGAGGGLCAGTAIFARNHNVKLAKQLVIAGNLDDRTVNPKNASIGLAKSTIWTIEDNITGWDAYLEPGHEFKNYIAPPAAPFRLENARGLAPLYLDVPALDIFREQGIEYAGRLAKAGVEVELHVYPGVPHAFEIFTPSIKLALMAFENRVRAMTSF